MIRVQRTCLALALILIAAGCTAPGSPTPTPSPVATASQAATPTADAHREQRETMVARTIEARGVSDPKVLRAMRAVPRHRFVPERYVDQAYEDHPLPIGHGQTISQPYIVAWMTELLELQPGERVLEIGTGSGYQAAVLAELEGVEVYTVEIIPELAAEGPVSPRWATRTSTQNRGTGTTAGPSTRPTMPSSSPPRRITCHSRWLRSSPRTGGW